MSWNPPNMCLVIGGLGIAKESGLATRAFCYSMRAARGRRSAACPVNAAFEQ